MTKKLRIFSTIDVIESQPKREMQNRESCLIQKFIALINSSFKSDSEARESQVGNWRFFMWDFKQTFFACVYFSFNWDF